MTGPTTAAPKKTSKRQVKAAPQPQPQDHFIFDLAIKTAEGIPVPDSNCIVNIKDEGGKDWRRFSGKTVAGGLRVSISMPNPPAVLNWELLCDRFHPHQGVFFIPRQNQTEHFDVTLFRMPNAWTPSFKTLAGLASPRFDRLRQVIESSNDTDLKVGGTIGDLNAKFDTLAEQPAILGKMALLNLHAVLTDEVDPIAGSPWFNHVNRIVRLDQERFIAEVDAALYENVQTIIEHINDWKAKGYFLEASSCLHNGNIPAYYPAPAEDTISVKWQYQQGNLQLTMTFIRDAGKAIHILDCDMDEHANIVLHAADIGKHDFTGGTSPVEMFDYIGLHSAAKQADRVSRCDLGYILL